MPTIEMYMLFGGDYPRNSLLTGTPSPQLPFSRRLIMKGVEARIEWDTEAADYNWRLTASWPKPEQFQGVALRQGKRTLRILKVERRGIVHKNHKNKRGTVVRPHVLSRYKHKLR